MIDNALSLSFSTWRKIAMATWRPRKDPMISATADIDATALLRYIEQVRAATGCHLSPAHLVGRAAAKVFQALPELNGRVVFGSFLPTPTIDCFFVVSLRTDPVRGAEAAKTDLSGAVVRQVDKKLPWMIAKELADRAGRIRHDDDPQFKRAKSVVSSSADSAAPSHGRSWVHHRDPPVAAALSRGRGPSVRLHPRQQRGHLWPGQRVSSRPDVLPRAHLGGDGCCNRHGVGPRRTRCHPAGTAADDWSGSPLRGRLSGRNDGPRLPRTHGQSCRVRSRAEPRYAATQPIRYTVGSDPTGKFRGANFTCGQQATTVIPCGGEHV
jgi:hypothetical protein